VCWVCVGWPWRLSGGIGSGGRQGAGSSHRCFDPTALLPCGPGHRAIAHRPSPTRHPALSPTAPVTGAAAAARDRAHEGGRGHARQGRTSVLRAHSAAARTHRVPPLVTPTAWDAQLRGEAGLRPSPRDERPRRSDPSGRMWSCRPAAVRQSCQIVARSAPPHTLRSGDAHASLTRSQSRSPVIAGGDAQADAQREKSARGEVLAHQPAQDPQPVARQHGHIRG
jgi:hypothetical protein